MWGLAMTHWAPSRLIVFNLYADDANGSRGGLVSEHIRGAFDFHDATEGIEVYGRTPVALLEGVRQSSPPGTPLRVLPRHEAGFTRSSAGR
jgi:hypothetical protein